MPRQQPASHTHVCSHLQNQMRPPTSQGSPRCSHSPCVPEEARPPVPPVSKEPEFQGLQGHLQDVFHKMETPVELRKSTHEIYQDFFEAHVTKQPPWTITAVALFFQAFFPVGDLGDYFSRFRYSSLHGPWLF